MVVQIVLGVLAGLFALGCVFLQRKVGAADAQRSEQKAKTIAAEDKLAAAEKTNQALSSELSAAEATSARLTSEVTEAKDELAEAEENLRKRTELADAQAMQIDVLSGERDEAKQKLAEAEEQIVTLAARPGVIVGDPAVMGDTSSEILWELELARSERSWRTSVSSNPLSDPSPFIVAEDPVRMAVEIEASALREDVGAMIIVDWNAEPISAPSRRLLVLRVAQEMLASAARVPGAARFIVTQSGEGDGDIKMEFESLNEDGETINLIAPHITHELVDVSRGGLSITVKAG